VQDSFHQQYESNKIDSRLRPCAELLKVHGPEVLETNCQEEFGSSKPHIFSLSKWKSGDCSDNLSYSEAILNREDSDTLRKSLQPNWGRSCKYVMYMNSGKYLAYASVQIIYIYTYTYNYIAFSINLFCFVWYFKCSGTKKKNTLNSSHTKPFQGMHLGYLPSNWLEAAAEICSNWLDITGCWHSRCSCDFSKWKCQ